MYECLVGYAPFYADDTVTTCKKIVNWQRSLVFPPDQPISPEARSLITQVRCVEFLELLLFSNSVAAENAFCSLPPALRLLGFAQLVCDSSTRLDINGIKAHPFFDGMAWDDPSDPCWTPCWVPELRDGDLVSAGSHWLPPHSCHAPCRSPRTAAPQKGFCGSVGS